MEKLTSVAGSRTVAEVELVYKAKVKAKDRPKITSSEDAYALIKMQWHDGKLDLVEESKVLFLDRGNKVIAYLALSTGGITSNIVDPRLVYAAALKVHACGIILAHNHPSGNKTPSASDKEITTTLKRAGELLAIRFLDHLIITRDGYFSFADEGLV